MPKKLTFEKATADQVQELRSDVMGPNGSMVKAGPLMTADAESDVAKGNTYNKDARTADFIMSAEAQDRMGDIVVQEGLDTTHFMKNPQGLLFHNSRSWPIGSWTGVSKNLGGRPKRTEGTLKLLPDGVEELADRAARHIEHGTLRAVSICFNVNWDACDIIRDEEGYLVGFRFNESELLECSLVPIPAMQLALMKSAPNVLAREHKEMLESILDTYALDPITKQLIRRDELEAKHRAAAGPQPTFLYLGDMSDDQKAALEKSFTAPSVSKSLQIAGGEFVIRAPQDQARHADKLLEITGFRDALTQVDKSVKDGEGTSAWDRLKGLLGLKPQEEEKPQDIQQTDKSVEDSAENPPKVDEPAPNVEERAQEISPEQREHMKNRVKAVMERAKVASGAEA